MIFRLYRRLGVGLGAAPTTKSVISDYTNVAVDYIRKARNELDKVLGSLQGRVLEREFRFPLILERIDRSPEVRTHFQYLREGYFIDTPFANAKGITTWRIAGRTQRLAVVDGNWVDGDAAIKEFGELIDDYFWPLDRGRNTTEYELYWLNFTAPISAEDPFGETEWLIHPTRRGVTTHQTSQRPFSRHFEFEFAGLQSNRDKAKSEDGFLAGLLSKGFLANLLEQLGLGEVTAVLNSLFGLTQEVKGFLDDLGNVATAAGDYVNGVRQTIQASIATVRGLLTATQTIIGRLEDAWDSLMEIPDDLEQGWNLILQSVPGLNNNEPNDITIAIEQVRSVQDFLLALELNRPAFDPTINPGDAEPSGAATRPIVIPPGATIEDLAQRYETDTETLIALNALTYPFVDAARSSPTVDIEALEAETARAIEQLTAAVDGLHAGMHAGLPPADIASLQHQVNQASARVTRAKASLATAQAATVPPPGVFAAGDSLLVPVPTPTTVAPSVLPINADLATRILASTGRAADTEDGLFGLDWRNEAGDLVWNVVRQDLEVERGTEHIAMTQVRYVRLPLGGLRYAPNLGNFAWQDMGQWQTVGTSQLLAYGIGLTLAQDPRVKSLRGVRAEVFRGVATLVHDLELIDAQRVSGLRVAVS